MARTQRTYSSTGCYHIMLRGNEKKNIILDDYDRQRFLEVLLKKKTETELAVYAYCLMDNHIHLVLRDEQNEISAIMKGIATSYAMYFNIKYNRVGHVFHDRFRSEPVENERYLWSVIRYVHNNPVKAGKVNEAVHYKWSSYRDYIDPEASNLVDSRYVLSMISRDIEAAVTEFKLFSKQDDGKEHIDDEAIIQTLDEGRIYLHDYLSGKWPGVEKAAIIYDKLLCGEIIQNLHANTGLSIRKIAELLEVNRRVVERVIAKQKNLVER